jgi:hypothetical protein
MPAGGAHPRGSSSRAAGERAALSGPPQCRVGFVLRTKTAPATRSRAATRAAPGGGGAPGPCRPPPPRAAPCRAPRRRCHRLSYLLRRRRRRPGRGLRRGRAAPPPRARGSSPAAPPAEPTASLRLQSAAARHRTGKSVLHPSQESNHNETPQCCVDTTLWRDCSEGLGAGLGGSQPVSRGRAGRRAPPETRARRPPPAAAAPPPRHGPRRRSRDCFRR